ncbi:sugar phosphate isomerase/epimerase [soil metagenome]
MVTAALPQASVLNIGFNPYGLTYTVGLQGGGTARANPEPLGLDGFIRLAHDLGARCIEVDWRWFANLSAADLRRVAASLEGVTPVYSHWLSQRPGESLDDAIGNAAAIGASILRLHLTPVLEGGRAAWGVRWEEMVAHARRVLHRDSPKAAEAGLVLAIENHQDFGSEELLAIVEELGAHAGIVFDTGNPFAVGEDPVAFARRAAPRIRHLHLKDYVAQFTAEGFRLVRCPIGDGAVPFAEIADVLKNSHQSLTASIEPGALEARHIRLFTPAWWDGYPPRKASELGTMLGRLRGASLAEDADARTPWEREAPGDELIAYETGQIRRSVENLRGLGLL